MNELHYIILIPILTGILLLFLPDRLCRIKSVVSIVVAAFAMGWAVMIFQMDDQLIRLNAGIDLFSPGTTFYLVMQRFGDFTVIHLDTLSRLVVLLSCLFALLILIYSYFYINLKKMPAQYYSWFLITIGCAAGAILADNLMMIIFFWGLLGFTLYMLIKGNTETSSATAKKTFIMIGASDGIMILGLAILWHLQYPLQVSAMSVPTSDILQVTAFLCLIIGAFTKAGAFPFHTWIPDYAQHAPASSSAYLPASLDKLLGIYLLARICNNMFEVNEWLVLTLMIIGILTIIIGVLMALVQHNYKRLLGYHAVSQVGYMIVGLAMGTPLGIAGGLFHMINNALYKSGLFLSAGSVERSTGKHNIGEVGGLSKVLPLTFFSSLIFALSISGIPPFNGFASKWLIYQGIVEFGTQVGVANQLWILWLVLAMFGSALTLASFMKFISGIFFGKIAKQFVLLKRESFLIWFPQVFIALICITLGVFASTIIPKYIMPVSGNFEYFGFWQSSYLSMLVLASILLGLIIYLMTSTRRMRVEENFLLGEKNTGEMIFSPLGYYKTISKAPFFANIYRKAEKQWFDIYHISKHIVLGFSKVLSNCHIGILPVYTIWIIAGLLLMLIIFI